MSTKSTISCKEGYHLYHDWIDGNIYLSVEKSCGCDNEIIIPIEVAKYLFNKEILKELAKYE